MEPIEVNLGQRTEPPIGGEQTIVASYAGFGSRHLLLIADGDAAPVASRATAQAALAALLARFRASLLPNARERLVDAFAEAHKGVERAARGTHAEGNAGASVIAAVIEPDRVTVARVGGGRAYMVVDGEVDRIYTHNSEECGYVGDQRSEPEFAERPDGLPFRGRLVVMTDATSRAVGADIAALATRGAPQLSAVRVIEAARHRGQRGALACLVAEMETDPADARRSGPRLLDPLERSIFDESRRRFNPLRAFDIRFPGAFYRLFLLLVAAGGAGIGAATYFELGPPPTGPNPLAVSREAGARTAPTTGPAPPAQPPPAPVRAPAADGGTSDAEREPDVGPAPWDPSEAGYYNEKITSVFAKDTPRHSARALKSYIVSGYRARGDRVFEELSFWIRQNRRPDVIAALLELIKDPSLPKTRAWLTELLPELHEVD